MNPAILTPADKIRMMKASLRCHHFGLAALLPVIGPLFGIVAAVESGQGRRYEKVSWNPARTQRLIGLNCAVAGTLVWTFVDLLVVWNILNPSNH